MSNLVESLQPGMSNAINSIKSTNVNVADAHKIINTFKSINPVDYNLGLAKFNGNEKLYHAYLSRMLNSQKFGSVSNLGISESLNCHGNESGNTSYRLH